MKGDVLWAGTCGGTHVFAREVTEKTTTSTHVDVNENEYTYAKAPFSSSAIHFEQRVH